MGLLGYHAETMTLRSSTQPARTSEQTQDYRGFVLQATYRIHQGVPVVYLFGRLEDGRTFVVRDHQQIPHFYLRSSDATNQAAQAGKFRLLDSDLVSLSGESLTRLDVQIPSDAPGVRDYFHGLGIPTFEADIRFAMRYLIDRDIRCGIRIRGVSEVGVGTALRFDNPQTFPDDIVATPRVLSFDIETNPAKDALLAIAYYGLGIDEVVVVDGSNRTMPSNAVKVPNEKAALADFCERLQTLDVDILTGWNVIDFDLAMLAKIAQRVGYDFQPGRESGAMRIRPAEGYFGSGSASIPGRVVLDGMDLVRGAFLRMDEYGLDAVARQVLGEGKTFGGKAPATEAGIDKIAEILRTYAHDLGAFCEYARTDARLALEIVEKLDLVRLAFARSALTGMTPDRVAASIASFDFLYLAELFKRGMAAPSVANPGQRGRVTQSGGAVFEPTAGMHENVWVCDFKSLYPSIIRTFNIDPLSFARAEQHPTVSTVDGASFASDKVHSILPGMLDTLFPAREAAKARGDGVASQAIKILMNSFYGVLGTPACRFYNPHIANAITGQGRYLLNWSKAWFEHRGFNVLYGDTDSVFVASGMADGDEAQAVADTLVQEFNVELQTFLKDRFAVESRLELEFEKLYTRLFLAKTRSGGQGARKRYAGIRHGEEEIDFVGMEVVRRDWTELAKDVQRNLFAQIFKQPDTAAQIVSGYLRDTVSALRNGELDDWLVYRKGLRKPVESYTTNIPPHVQAVKKSSADAPRVVHYIMTEAGPELTTEMMHAPDREHYIEKQIRPVAEPVLEAMQLSFAQVIGDDKQISLF